jgi:hypothetical protein
MTQRTDRVITRTKQSPFHNLSLGRIKERKAPFIITLVMVKKPYLVEGGLMVKRYESKIVPKNKNDMADKGDSTISTLPVLILCQINERMRMFVERKISVKAR